MKIKCNVNAMSVIHAKVKLRHAGIEFNEVYRIRPLATTLMFCQVNNSKDYFAVAFYDTVTRCLTVLESPSKLNEEEVKVLDLFFE